MTIQYTSCIWTGSHVPKRNAFWYPPCSWKICHSLWGQEPLGHTQCCSCWIKDVTNITLFPPPFSAKNWDYKAGPTPSTSATLGLPCQRTFQTVQQSHAIRCKILGSQEQKGRTDFGFSLCSIMPLSSQTAVNWCAARKIRYKYRRLYNLCFVGDLSTPVLPWCDCMWTLAPPTCSCGQYGTSASAGWAVVSWCWTPYRCLWAISWEEDIVLPRIRFGEKTRIFQVILVVGPLSFLAIRDCWFLATNGKGINPFHTVLRLHSVLTCWLWFFPFRCSDPGGKICTSMPPSTQAAIETPVPADEPNVGFSPQLPWTSITKFVPSTTNVQEYVQKLKFLAAMWPEEYLSLLAVQLSWLRGQPFSKWPVWVLRNFVWTINQGSNYWWKLSGGLGVPLNWRRDTSFSTRPCMAPFSDMMNLMTPTWVAWNPTLWNFWARAQNWSPGLYVLLRQSLLAPHDKKKILLEHPGELKYEPVVKFFRLLGMFFSSKCQD